MEYQWVRSNRKTTAIQINEKGDIIVRSPYSVSRRKVEQMLREKQDWIEKHQKAIKERENSRREITEQERREGIERAKQILPARIQYYAKIMGVTYGRITLREQKTRWGSCSSKGNLNFNWKLALMPDEILDYVVVHELAHRMEMNHSDKFWKIVENVLPDYRERRKWLKECRL
ncbi:MAG: M48 family metallopeptidase [Oliverpabstia sp.]|nr:M48 family metallopeptidase [Lachnospiraceae bacterium]MDY5026691.1 M48 family metallopeptidase [Oliverpabstia sp.]